MKRQTLKIFCSGILMSFALVLTGCGGEETPSNPTQEDTTQTADDDQEPTSADLPSTYIQLPSPNELLNFIKDGGLSFDGGLLPSHEEVADVVGKRSQSLSFGQHFAQLAYASSFDQAQESLKAFSSMQRLSQDLGISYVFSDILVSRVKSNIENPDSLEHTFNASYFSTIKYLEDNDKGDVLAMIAAGGWIESMYLVTQSVAYAEGNETVDRIADQKITFESLMLYLDQYQDNEDITAIASDLKNLNTIFEGIGGASEESTSLTKSDDHSTGMVLGGSSVAITGDQYEELKNEIARLRSSLSGNA